MKNKLTKSHGFTLIELLLYVGIVAIMTIAIYGFYSKRQVDSMVHTLSNNLEIIDNGVLAAYSTSSGFGALNNTFAIAADIIPKELIIDANNAGNTFGGNIILGSTVVSGNPGYSITLDKMPSYACTKLATSNFVAKIQEIYINSVIVKTAGASLNPTQIVAIAAQCNNPLNTIMFNNTLLSSPLDATGTSSSVRAKELPYYIATVGSPSAAVGPACVGGSAWNGSFCSCPVNTEWNGSTCVTFNTQTPQPGWCQRGQGWLPETKICVPLPHGSSSNLYSGNRNLPGSITTPPIQTLVGGQIIPVAGTEVLAGRTITWGAGQVDDTTVQVCVNGNWSVTYKRCVTP
jgi:type II secretory pathway pseudopilin PulG